MIDNDNHTIAVTGAGGFLGSAIAREFADRGADVVALIRPHGDTRRLDGVRARIHECDIEDAPALRRSVLDLAPDIVVHCAVAAGHPIDDETAQRAWSVNSSATVGLLDAMTELPDSRLIHVGSSLEYAPSSDPLSEESRCEPVSVRGESKLAATMAVRAWCQDNGRQGVVLRPFSVYGPRQQPERLIPTLFRCAHTGEPFQMVPGVSRRDFVWLGDVARACALAASVTAPECPVINVGSGTEHSVAEILDMVERATGKHITVEAAGRERQSHDVEHWVADTSRCRKMLGWTPDTSLFEGLTRLAACQ